jgi:SAM-dependent methyltransferase
VLETLSSGRFSEDPLHGILKSQAWGESPLPFIEHESWCYVRCCDCGQTFHRRILAPAWMERLYARWESQAAMESFLAANETAQERAQQGAAYVAHALQLQRMAGDESSTRALRLLDFGCGHGQFVTVCRALGFDAVGVDFAPDRRRHGMVAVYASLDELQCARAHEPAFDAVTLLEVLEHQADPRGVLQQLSRLMRPGALLLLTTPDTSGVTGLQSFDDYLAIGPLGHINGFTPGSLRAMAERAGFVAARPPAVWVAASWQQAVKTTARSLLARWRRRTTSQYFVRG